MPTGGELLRKLRLERALTLEDLEAESEMSYRALSNIELGVTRKPTAGTLDAILSALHRRAPVSMEARRAVYIACGYHPPSPLPTGAEIAAARAGWRVEYGDHCVPAYMIDVSQRLLAFNGAAPRLVGLHRHDRRARHFDNATTIDLAFGLAQRFVEIENAELYRCSFVGVLMRELCPYATEGWYAPCLAAAQRRYPEFKRLWEMEHPPPASPIGCPVPLRLRLPGCNDALIFCRVKIPFVGDPRFQTVAWLPVGASTWRTWTEKMIY